MVSYAMGVALIVASAVSMGGRYVCEEGLMNVYDVPPVVVASGQGVLVLTICLVVLAVAHMTGLEDFYLTIAMVKASAPLQLMMVDFVVATLVYNVCAVSTLKSMGATVKALLRGTKVCGLGVIQIVWYHFISKLLMESQTYGEPWSSPGSWLLLTGTFGVTAGVVIYAIPDEKKEECEKLTAASECTPLQPSVLPKSDKKAEAV